MQALWLDPTVKSVLSKQGMRPEEGPGLYVPSVLSTTFVFLITSIVSATASYTTCVASHPVATSQPRMTLSAPGYEQWACKSTASWWRKVRRPNVTPIHIIWGAHITSRHRSGMRMADLRRGRCTFSGTSHSRAHPLPHILSAVLNGCSRSGTRGTRTSTT